MTDIVIVILLLCSFGYYLMFLSRIRFGLKKTVRPTMTSSPTVSVILAARNESLHIRRCLDSLLRQEYDSSSFEIVVIDDHSFDNTPQIVSEYSGQSDRPPLRLIEMSQSSKRSGKPEAIAAGVSSAKGEIILCTDADCLLPPTWIGSMARCFEREVSFVAGPVVEKPSDSLLTHLQSLEFLGLITTAAGLIGSGSPIICNGANIAYRKSTYEQIKGYGTNETSCDDETLMQRMKRRQAGQIVFNSDPGATVLTESPRSIKEFWNQRTRWASKRGHYEDSRILYRLLALYFFFSVFFAAAVHSFFNTQFLPLVLGVFLLKAGMEYLVLSDGARHFSHRPSLLHFLIAELFHVPYIVFAAAFGQITPIRWKDRTLNQ